MFLPFEMIWQGEYENVQFALCNDYGLFHLWWRNQKKYSVLSAVLLMIILQWLLGQFDLGDDAKLYYYIFP